MSDFRLINLKDGCQITLVKEDGGGLKVGILHREWFLPLHFNLTREEAVSLGANIMGDSRPSWTDETPPQPEQDTQ